MKMNPIIYTMIRISGRSWWEARYSDGSTVAEWDTLMEKVLWPIGSGSTSRWEEVSKDHMVALRILCPNGQAGELTVPEGHRFFQLKHGGVDVTIGGEKSARFRDAHLIGVADGIDGSCSCYTWEAYERTTCPEFEALEDKLIHVVTPEDIAKVKQELENYCRQGYGKWRWRLRFFNDNVHNMKYRSIGPLALEVQGLKP